MAKSTEFFAHHIVARIDRKTGSYVLGLSDRAKDPEEYVLFYRPFEFDEEAVEAEEDCHWFQFKRPALSAFGACTKARIFPDRLEIDIARSAGKIHRASGGKITVKFKPSTALTAKLKKYLELIL